MTDPAPKKHKLNDPQWFALRAIADQIVPPSAKYSVPGGGDEQICKEVLGDVGQNLPKLIDTLEAINTIAHDLGGNDLGQLETSAHEAIALTFRHTHPKLADRLAMWVTQCYYRDERVLESLGLDARPPFPQGYEIESGDWAELKPVTNRSPIFRSIV